MPVTQQFLQALELCECCHGVKVSQFRAVGRTQYPALAPYGNVLPGLELGDKERGMWSEMLAGSRADLCPGGLYRKVSQV